MILNFAALIIVAEFGELVGTGLVTYFNASGKGEFLKEIGETNSRIAAKDATISDALRIVFKYVLTGICLVYFVYFSYY